MNIIDVGASHGTLSDYLSQDPENQIFAVEPLFDIAAKIPKRRNLKIFVTAIRDVDTSQKQVFTHSSFSELSSFLELNPNIDKELWKHHLKASIPIQSTTVDVMSLQKLIEDNNIRDVHFLKIDAQGLDLEVLRSARQCIDTIQSVVLEFPYDKKSALYKDESALIEGLLEANKLGFLPARVVPNGGGECNVFLYNEKHGLNNFLEIERQLKLFDAPTLKLNYKYGKKIRKWIPHRISIKFNKARKIIGF